MGFLLFGFPSGQKDGCSFEFFFFFLFFFGVLNSLYDVLFIFPFSFNAAIITYKTLPLRKELKKLIHLVLHAIALILGIIGIYTAFKFHNESNIVNLYSLHSWLGIGIIVLYGIQVTSSLNSSPALHWLLSIIIVYYTFNIFCSINSLGSYLSIIISSSCSHFFFSLVYFLSAPSKVSE